MINCNYLVVDEFAFFLTVVSEKKGKSKRALNPLTLRVSAAYQTYLNNFGLLCRQHDSLFANDLQEIKDHLQKCYSSPTRSFKRFKNEYYDRQPSGIVELCPYCMLDTPYSLDHYVGQTEFPEYSILTKNLFPCCFKCNNEKNDDWRANGIKTFINFYDDQFLSHRFLYADLVVNGTIPCLVYKLVQPVQINDDDFALISRHFSALDLLGKYAKKSNNKLTAEIQSTKAFVANGKTNAEIVEDLNIRYNSSVAQYGQNYWASQIYAAIADSVQIIRAL